MAADAVIEALRGRRATSLVSQGPWKPLTLPRVSRVISHDAHFNRVLQMRKVRRRKLG